MLRNHDVRCGGREGGVRIREPIESGVSLIDTTVVQSAVS